MTSPYTADPRLHVEQIAVKLNDIKEIEAPEWADFVKTSPHKQRMPMRDDWWTVRAAAVLRSVDHLGPVGVNKLRRKYGGRQRRGYQPAKFRRAGGSVLRNCLQQLEKAELVKQVDINGHKGRIVTPKGKSVIAQAAKEVSQQ